MRAIFAIFVVLFSMALPASAGEEPVYTGWLNNRAVSGYDVVAYYTDGKPTKGKKEFSTEYKGAEWRFSTAANLAIFKENPAKYEPQYGGYCAWGLANGHAVSSNPEAWAIVEGKLYLNYDKKVQKRWLEDTDWAIAEADKQFPELIDTYMAGEK